MNPDIDAIQEQRDGSNLANQYFGPYTREEKDND